MASKEELPPAMTHLTFNFLLFWQGQFFNQIGYQGSVIGMIYWLKYTTNSATLIGLPMMMTNLPAVIFGLLGGVYADQHSHRRILICGDVANGLSVLAMAMFLFAFHDQIIPGVAVLFAVSATLGVISAFYIPTVSAAIPDMAPHTKIVAVNSMYQF